MGGMKDFVIWMEENNYVEWNEHQETYEYTEAAGPHGHNAVSKYLFEQQQQQENNDNDNDTKTSSSK